MQALTLDDVQALLKGLLGGWPVVGWIDSGHIGASVQSYVFGWTEDIEYAKRLVQRELQAGTRLVIVGDARRPKLSDINAERAAIGLPELKVHG